MGVKCWIKQDYESGDYYLLDEFDQPGSDAYGPVELSNETYERIMEHEREHRVIQDILDSLRYDWEYPDKEIVRDCD